MRDNGDLIPDDRFQVTTEAIGNTKLIIQNVQLSDAGVYFCVAENEKGRVKCAATLRVNGQSLSLTFIYHCIGLAIHCNYHVGHYSGFSRISPSILNRFTPNLQA